MSNISLPDKWKIDKFNSVIRNIVDNRGKTPPLVEEGIELLEVNSITKNRVEPNYSKVSKFVSSETYKSWFRAHPEANDILIPTVGTIGVAALIKRPRGTIAQNIVAIQISKEHNSQYWYYYVCSEKFLEDVMRVLMVAIQPSLKVPHMRSFIVPVPPVEQQQKIAKILTTIDQLIEKTQALIDKHTAIKKGMMTDLFTRGIDLTTGQLRPPVEQTPHLYKETALGWIPKDWQVNKLLDFFSIKHGYAFEGEYFTDKPPGQILLTPGNFHRTGGLYFTSNNTKYYTASYIDEYVLGKGDYLVVMTDLSPQTLILGRFVFLNNDIPLLHNQRIGKLIPTQRIDWEPGFLIGLLSQEYLRKNIVLTATGTTVRHTSPDRILDNHVIVPSLDEQKAIGEILKSNNLRIKTCHNEAAKYEKLKSGLMQDLLTGKVRV